VNRVVIWDSNVREGADVGVLFVDFIRYGVYVEKKYTAKFLIIFV
jgi:hypothetical protein